MDEKGQKMVKMLNFEWQIFVVSEGDVTDHRLSESRVAT